MAFFGVLGISVPVTDEDILNADKNFLKVGEVKAFRDLFYFCKILVLIYDKRRTPYRMIDIFRLYSREIM